MLTLCLSGFGMVSDLLNMFGMYSYMDSVCCWHGIGMVLFSFWFNVAMLCMGLVFAGMVLK